MCNLSLKSRATCRVPCGSRHLGLFFWMGNSNHILNTYSTKVSVAKYHNGNNHKIEHD